MKTQTFGIIIAVIVLAWLAALYFLGWGRWQAYDEQTKKAEQITSKLKRLAKTDVAEFPSDELREATEHYRDDYENAYNAALKHFADRDKEFEKFITSSQNPSAEDWGTRQQDELSELRTRYEETTGADAKFVKFSTSDGLKKNQLRWTTYKLLLEALIQHGGTLTGDIKDGKLRGAGMLEKSEYFDRWEWTVEAEMPAKAVPSFLNTVLGDSKVAFEVAGLTVAKRKESLVLTSLVEASLKDGTFDPPQLEEPPVRVRLVGYAADWKYEKPKPKTDEDE